MNYRKSNFIFALVGSICYGIGWYSGQSIYYFLFGFSFGQIWYNYRKEKRDRENEI